MNPEELRTNNLVRFCVRHESLLANELVCECSLVLDEIYPEVLYHKNLKLTSKDGSVDLRNRAAGNLKVSFALRIFEESPFDTLDPKYAEKVKIISTFLVSEDLLLARTLVSLIESKSQSFSVNGEFFQSMMNSILARGFQEAIHLVRILLRREVDGLETSDLLFRENSTVNGIIIFLCKKFGSPYASSVVNPIISKLLKSGDSLEIDPRRISSISNHPDRISLEKNEQIFKIICKSLVDSICNSLNDVPL